MEEERPRRFDPADIQIRPAALGEISAAARVYLLSEDEALARQAGRAPQAETAEGDALLAAAADDLVVAAAEGPERVLVAVAGADGEVVGVAAWRGWDQWWFLAYLFILPAWQDKGLGRALLERSHAAGVAAGCTAFSLFASRDPRALTRYLALGVVPQPPVIDLRAEAGALRPPPLPWDDGLTAHPLGPGEPDPAALATLGDLDRVTRGARRQTDLLRWLRAGATAALLADWQTGKPAGYYLVSAPGEHPTPGEPAHGRIGPVVALDLERFPTILARALVAAEPLARTDLTWRVSVPGQNRAALAPLFAAGFRPRALQNYLASAPLGRWDRYIMRDEDDV
jgi:GNAT superfamily N-acetyltransferase